MTNPGLTISPQQVASATLVLVSKVSITADDESIAMVQAVRGMLRAIVEGALIVVQPPAPAPAPIPKEVE